MSIANYIWLYLSEKDIEIFNSAFWKTPNLYCHNNAYNLICPAMGDENKLHSHNEVWNLTNSNFSLLYNSNKDSFIIEVIWKQLEIDEDFAKYLISLVFKAHETAKKIKSEGKYGEVEPYGVEATIYSLINKWKFSETSITISDITVDLLISFACRHKFKNGNKRTALITAVLFLKFCGLYLWKTDKQVEEYLTDWEYLMVYIVETTSKREISEKMLFFKVKSIIDSCLTLSYNEYNII